MTPVDYAVVDLAALDRWLAGHLDGYSGDPRLTLVSGGQSTPTYRLESGDRRWALRRRPPGEWPAYLFRSTANIACCARSPAPPCRCRGRTRSAQTRPCSAASST
jgi:hypothetical protein